MHTVLGQRLVVWLGVSGVSAFLYATYLPLPPVSDEPLPVVWWVSGVLMLVTAVGVLRRAGWARWLAAAIVTVQVAWAAWVEATWMLDQDLAAWWGGGQWLDPLIRIVLPLLALWWLVMRWPPSWRQANRRAL
jgi:hypothetical protein